MKVRDRFYLASGVSVFVMLLIAGLFWVGGYDFDKRGELAVLAYLLIVPLGGIAFFAAFDLSKYN